MSGRTISLKPNSTNTATTAEFVKITDGTNTASVRDTGSSDSLNVAIVDASGNQITSFGSSISALSTNAPDTIRITNLTNAAQAIKASAGNLYGWNIINPNTTVVYVKFYNTAAASVLVGTTAVVLTIMVPASGSIYLEPSCIQQHFTTAIAVACVLNLADNDTTDPGASDIFIDVRYK